jgi:hypothetical protein
MKSSPLAILSLFLLLLLYRNWGLIRFIYDIRSTLSQAENGDAEAQAEVGRIQLVSDACALPFAIPCNREEGEQWLLRSAAQGNARGEFLLGFIYSSYHGIKMNPDKAIKWLQASAEQGYQPAQEKLGHLYLATKHQCIEYGDGKSSYCDVVLPKPHYEEAYFWLALSLPKTDTICRDTSHFFWSSNNECFTQPNAHNAEEVADAAKNLTPRQKAAADKRVAQWLKDHPVWTITPNK